jgi:type II secretory pathway pseudopilin PulG
MTLLEIMIVIFIIGIISSVIGYNMKGSLEKAKAFKTTEGIKKITEIFELELAQGTATIQNILNHPAVVLDNSGFVTNPAEFLKDGWGVPYKITATKSGKPKVHSEAYLVYLNKKKVKQQNAIDEIAVNEDLEVDEDQ